jgi:prenyltransferase beta subunit
MKTLSQRLLQTAAGSRAFLEAPARRQVARFILSRQNSDGGFCGKAAESDLYYTVFAAAGLQALGAPVPALRLWNYLRRFGFGENLDLIHFACLIQLRSSFPMIGKIMGGGSASFQALEKRPADSAYDRFFKQLAGDALGVARLPSVPPSIRLSDPTPNLSAAAILNPGNRSAAGSALLDRACPRGGFAATAQLSVPDLLSTATALFALVTLGADIDSIRRPCLDYVESLWRDSGGFAGHVADEIEDVEYTFYALLSIGCLMARE